MVLPSCSFSQWDGTEDKGNVSAKSKIIRKAFPKKARKLSRRRRKAKRRSEKYIKERKQMATLGKGPYDYYWGNYFRCVKWVQNHHASYWKSRAQALQYENSMLRALIEKSSNQPELAGGSFHSHDCRNNMYRHMKNIPSTEQGGGWETRLEHEIDNTDHSGKEQTNIRGDPDEGEEFEFEVDDNMIEFFTQSMKHKMELQRERNQDNDNKDSYRGHTTSGPSKSQRRKSNNVETKNDDEFSFDECMMGLKRVLPVQSFEGNETVEAKDLEDILFQKAQREEKEKLKNELFGKSASKILGMETAVQLNFRQFCAHKHPVMWPIIPLNL